MMSYCATHVTSSMVVQTDALADYHSLVVYYSREGRIHLYEVDCSPPELGEAVVAMQDPNRW